MNTSPYRSHCQRYQMYAFNFLYPGRRFFYYLSMPNKFVGSGSIHEWVLVHRGNVVVHSETFSNFFFKSVFDNLYLNLCGFEFCDDRSYFTMSPLRQSMKNQHIVGVLYYTDFSLIMVHRSNLKFSLFFFPNHEPNDIFLGILEMVIC